MKRLLLPKLFALVAALMCVIGVQAKDAYAVYTSSHSLTFYFDDLKDTRHGLKTFDVAIDGNDVKWREDNTYLDVNHVTFDPSFAEATPLYTADWFNGMTGLLDITGLNYLNTSRVIDMNDMFRDCSSLTSQYIDLSSLNTSNVTNMSCMFYGCSRLTSLDLSNFNTSNVTNMSEMFCGCTILRNLNLNSFNTSQVVTMRDMFNGCNRLKSLNLSNFNTSYVHNMSGMFESCNDLTELDLSNFDTSNVTDMSFMFFYCSSLSSLDVSNFNTLNVTNMYYMFNHCTNLTSLDLSSFNTVRVINMYGMFKDCPYLQRIYVGEKWSTKNVSTSYVMFDNCRNIVGGMGTTYNENQKDAAYAHIDGGPNNPGYLSDINQDYAVYTSDNTTLTFYHDRLRSTREGTTYDLNVGYETPAWYTDNTSVSVTRVVFDPSFAASRRTSTYYWFAFMTKLQSITGMNYLNTSEVIEMSHMFFRCSGLTSLDVSGFNTSNVTNMMNMFAGCSGLSSLDLSSFNTANVVYTNGMFSACTHLTTLDLSGFNTANVKSMNAMFDNCINLTTLDLSGFNTANVTDMSYMFRDCKGLSILELGNFITSKVTNMSYMFSGCNNLTTIDVRHVWSTASVTQSSDMFKNCSQLVGEKGTTYNPNHTDAAYAHIDGGLSNPGYLSEAKEAYVMYSPGNTRLWFYYDCLRATRGAPTYDLNDGDNDPGWSEVASNVTQVMFDPSFAKARPTSTCSWFRSMNRLQIIVGMNYLNTEHVTNMRYMFQGCSSLMTLDLSVFNTANVVNMAYMFDNCNNLITISVGDGWNISAVTSSQSMFGNCTSLVGGMGTTYNPNHVDKSYAHIDGGSTNPGYLSDLREAYAEYTSENNRLTFYCDGQRSSRTGTTYDLNTGNFVPSWYYINQNITQVEIDPSFAGAYPVTAYAWFSGMSNLQSVTGLNYLKTDNLTDMGNMFQGCSSLTYLDLRGLNTSHVTNMIQMFNNCSSLISIDVSDLNTENVINAAGMFRNCSSLTALDLSSFNTAKVTDMRMMFESCSNLSTIYVGSGWSTASVTESFNMFIFCNSLVGSQGTAYSSSHIDAEYAHVDGGPDNPGYFTDANASSEPEAYACFTPSDSTLTFYFDTGRLFRPGTTYDLNTGISLPDWSNNDISTAVTQVVFDPSFADTRPETTACWFYHMYYLKSITGMAEYLNTVDVTDMTRMFYECSSLPSVDLSGFNTSKVENMTDMFRNCHDLIKLDLTSFNTSQVTRMDGMFCNCVYLTTIYVGDGWSTDAVTSSIDMFYYCFALVGGKGTAYDEYHSHTDAEYAHIDGGPINPGYFTDPNAPEAYACYTSGNATLTFYFDHQRNEREGTTYDLNKDYDEPEWLTDGNYSSVTQVVFDPSFADAYPRTTFLWFEDMVNLQSIEGMEYLNTSNVINMVEMFYNCSALTSLDVSGFNTANVTEMTWMFGNCHQLTGLDVSGFDTHNVTDMSAMFAECHELTGLDLSGFNTSNVKYMTEMFATCHSLTSLDLSSFNTSNVNFMDGMFNGCSNLSTIFVGDEWSTNAVISSDNMFTGCTSLVGGKGTTYDANYVDDEYAHIDGGPSNPGYFTAKVDFLRGDVNGDGQVSIGDVTTLIDLLLSGGVIDNPAADCNQDENVSIGDVTALIDYLLGGSW